MNLHTAHRRVRTLALKDWTPQVGTEQTRALAADLEQGCVLHLPDLGFALSAQEQRFLDPRWADPKAKNISYDGARDQLAGAVGEPSDREGLRGLLSRFRERAVGLVGGLFPRYRESMQVARTSLRPQRVEGRQTSWRKDDSRLHVDAFPSRPNHGDRILRVFSNVHPAGEPRVWRVGEPFEDVAQRFLPEVTAPVPGSAWLMHQLHVTKGYRTRYDHTMLQLHDRMKADEEYQQRCSQVTVPFAAGSTWICFSDQTSHAAMSGQFLMEQTINLAVSAMYNPERSPLMILESLLGALL